MKKIVSQSIMIWFLPIILIGGLFNPVLGYLVFFMMIFFLVLSYFKGRFWCSFLCPRGAFLDLVLSKISLKRKIPKFFYNQKIRMVIFFIFIGFFIFQFIISPKNLYATGFIFVRMCIVTTLLAIILGVPIHQRVWCIICPMGNLQEKIRNFNKNKGAK
ncbi:MAG: 4Fe-4S binding protein [Candidatus Omnitrophica bacterium]|nr:4Fe-4S binding protein [Candidatus Omnitrophota bacterium]MCM8831703.1 4Fe-4S binding protein [Candidatus Omnitrophota bacterium]